MATLTTNMHKKKKLNSALAALTGFKEFSIALGMGGEGAEELARDIRCMVSSTVDDIRIRRIVARAAQVHKTVEDMTRFRSLLLTPFHSTLKIALVVVDFQNDFVQGSLSIKNGSARDDPKDAIPILNDLLREGTADLVVYTLDWHPPNHISFYEHCRNSDRRLSLTDRKRKLKPFEAVVFDDPPCAQMLYPSHCVQGTWGADLDPLIHIDSEAEYIHKGTEVLIDSYSAFQDNEGLHKTPLEELLRRKEMTAVIGCGLAYEICVAATLKDSACLGFYTGIIAEASKGLDKAKIAQTNEEFTLHNIAILSKTETSSLLRRKLVPIEWIEKRANELLAD